MDWLKGRQVVVTGKLASMTRKEAARVITRHGGQWASTVNGHTTFVVVGQEGWPLQQDGKLTGTLQKASKLQEVGHDVTVLSEEEFLAKLGLKETTEGVHRLYTLAQLTRIVQVPRDRLRGWVKEGLIRPKETADGIDYFDFRQVVGAKTLLDLLEAGVGLDRVRRSLRQLKAWIKDVDQPLSQLALLEENGDLLVRVEEGLAEPSGQLILDFSTADRPTVTIQPPTSAGEWFDLGCEHEEQRRFPDAIDAYRQALIQGGPDPDISYNLANCLYATGHKDLASERYWQVVEARPTHGEAWNNLGIVLRELGKTVEAKRAFQKAVEAHFTDAHFNLGELLEAIGRPLEAQPHWQAVIRSNPQDRWGRYARSRLMV